MSLKCAASVAAAAAGYRSAGAGPNAVTAVRSATLRQAQDRARGLYRQCLRAAPLVADKYQMDLSPQEVNGSIRRMFTEHRGVQDTHTMDLLVHNGKTELEEILEVFKTRSHVLTLFQLHGDENVSTEEKEWGFRGGETEFLRNFLKDGPYEE